MPIGSALVGGVLNGPDGKVAPERLPAVAGEVQVVAIRLQR